MFLMDFLFGLFSFTAALPKQAFQEHSAVWDVILIRNTVENSTLSSLPSPYDSYHKLVFLLRLSQITGERDGSHTDVDIWKSFDFYHICRKSVIPLAAVMWML